MLGEGRTSRSCHQLAKSWDDDDDIDIGIGCITVSHSVWSGTAGCLMLV